MDATGIYLLIIALASLMAIGMIAAAVAFVLVGRVAFHNSSASAAEAFGLLFLALPSLSTIVLIVLATAILTAMGILKPEGCIAIFSGVASFVLGAETQKRKNAADALPSGNAPTPAEPGQGKQT